MAELSGWLDDYFWGAMVVLKVFGVSLTMAVIFGLMGASAKLSKNRIANKIANAYTITFRGTPEILVLLLFYYGSAIALTKIVQIFFPQMPFVDIPPFWAGSLSIGLIVGSYATETFRGAFMGVDPGIVEASRALGISNLHTFFYVRIPQMWRLALPAFGNHMLSIMKDTALISIIGLEEILFVAEMATAVTLKPFTMYMIVALIYLSITTVITMVVMLLEKHANRHLEVAK
ncbi:ABC transporter permease [Desulfobacula sp.]|uniref:ABC transporter permease n=1 Tax=Desulfobacula sp. TaxID=2593537 RepID=UPI002603282D|nr:ABC transporter permease [Desulfobacula sp.]